MPRTLWPALLIGGLALAIAACSKAPSSPAVEVPILSDLSTVDPAGAAFIRESFDAAVAAPGDAEARAALAMAYQAHAMNESAVATYEQALDLDANHARWWYLLAQARKQTGHDDAALEAIGRSIELDPTYPASHTRRGFWLLQQGRFEEAAASFDGAIARTPDDINARIGLARVAQETGDKQRASDTLAALHEERPDDPYIAYLLGVSYRQTGRMDEAQVLLEAGAGSQINWRGLDPWTGDMQLLERGYRVDYQLAQDYLKAKRPDKAIEILRSLRERYPNDIPVMTSLAGALTEQGQLNAALETLNAALRIDPNHFVVHLNLGGLYLKRNDLQLAAQHTDEAIRLNPSLAQGHFQMGRILFMSSRFAEAETSLRKSIEQDPTLVPAHLLLVLALDRQQKTTECIGVLEQLIETFPNEPDGYIMLAQIYRGQGRLTAAQELATVAGRKFPDNPKVLQLKQALGIP